MKVFLVDDNPTALKMLGHALTRAGYEIDVARDGAEALAKIPASQPDIVVLDVMMPNMDGIETTRRLRENPQTAGIPIILLTARDRIEDKLSGFGSGADDYVVKPVLPAELVARIAALLRRSHRAATEAQRGRTISFWGVKGGIGTTTLAVNVAIALAQSNKRVILGDLQPWAGTAALQMGLIPRASVSALAEREPADIDRRMIEDSLERHRSEVRLFGIPARSGSSIGDLDAERLLAVVNQMELLADVVVLDLGNGLSPTAVALMQRAFLCAVILEAEATALHLAGEAIARLGQAGLAGSHLAPIVVNRVRSASTYTREEIEERLGSPLATVITPNPEIFFHASRVGTPIVIGQPDGIVSMQIRELAGKLI
jgi:DNA-binding response OmpR family regulator